MPAEKFPFAVRLVGFAPEEALVLTALLAQVPDVSTNPGPGYFCLSDDSLQEPDLLIANGAELSALAALSTLASGEVRPALIVGDPVLALPYPSVLRPVEADSLHAELQQLVERRADALAELAASGLPALPERRLRQRLDFDLTDPAEYEALRHPGSRGAVLVVDRNASFQAHLERLLQPYSIPVVWAGSEAEAARVASSRAVAVALVNTAMQLDPYRLSAMLRQGGGPLIPAVVLLVSAPFVYDRSKAQASGVAGLLDKPVADHHLKAVLKKLMGMS